jgi:hypothetical protein
LLCPQTEAEPESKHLSARHLPYHSHSSCVH